MMFAARNSIVISPDRQRREHDEAAHQELITSLQGPQGLMHPPVMRIKDGQLILVAGERRLLAMDEIWESGGDFTCGCDDVGMSRKVPAGLVPYLLLGNLSPLEAEEAEFEENIRRKDLTWQERVDTEARLYELRGKRAALEGKPPPTIADIAAEARGSANDAARDGISKSLVLAKNLHRPEVKGAATAHEAFKALMRAEEGERNRAVGEKLGPTLATKHQLVLGDSLEWMGTRMVERSPELFDVICADPIYGMGADEFGDSGGGAAGAHFYKDTYEEWHRHMSVFVPASFHLTKPDAHAYVFCDFARFTELKALMEVEGWKVFRTPLIWFKPSAFRAPWPDQGPQRKYECILYAVKGSLKTTTLRGDVITCPPDANLGHQAQKPVELYRDLLARSVRPGMRVLDPFCGTGPIFPAAHALGAVATGVEMDEAAYGIAVQRLLKLKES